MENTDSNENIIYIIGKEKENNMLKTEFGLGENTNPDDIEIQNKWNVNQINTDELLDANPSYREISEKIEELRDQSDFDPDYIYSFTIIYILDNFEEQKNDINLLLEIIQNKTPNSYYQPFIIFILNSEKNEEENSLVELTNISKDFQEIDKRNISYFIYPLNTPDNSKKNQTKEEILNKLYLIYSYFYGLGDEFVKEGKKYKLYKVKNEELCPINILVLGATQQGKTTFINTLIKSKKGREGYGKSKTKKQIIYHIDNVPLYVYDIEGFNGEDTIQNVVDEIELMQNL